MVKLVQPCAPVLALAAGLAGWACRTTPRAPAIAASPPKPTLRTEFATVSARMKHLKAIYLFLQFFTLVFANSAIAAAPSSQEIANKCKNADDASIQEMLAEINEINQMLPTVPPEEAQYLQAENDRFQRAHMQEIDAHPRNQSHSNKILAQLESRRYYAVWSLRNDIDYVQFFLKSITEHVTEIDKASSVANALPTLIFYRDDALDALFKNKIDASEADKNKLEVSALLLPSRISEYLKCKLAKAAK